MIRRLLAVVALAACGGGERPAPGGESLAAAPPPADTAWTVSPAGIGPIRVGWSVAQLNAATGERLVPRYDVSEGCGFLRPATLPAGVALMIIDDSVGRVDVDTTGILTADGIGVGDSEAVVLRRYAGRIVVTPHHYTGPEGHDLTVTLPDTTRRIIFETDGRRVLRYRAGRLPGVVYIEGCA